MQSPTEFRMPPVLHTAEGRMRRVGVEVEFAGLDEQHASELVIGLYGGTARSESKYSTDITGTALGDFKVELDSHVLKDQRGRDFLDRIGVPRPIEDAIESVIDVVARQFVPSEIVAPPVALSDLPRLEELRSALQAHHADGTRKSVFYTFGFQLNPELPASDAGTLRRYLAAFLVLYDWLVDVSEIDFTRKLASFIDPFPDSYRCKVLSAGYAPDIDGLIDDYLEANPTRNRPLDMLPAFATLRRDEVLARAKEHDQVKPRPTFHYRLPNCLIDEPDWSFALEWNRWVEVERLAEDAPRLARLSSAFVANAGDDGRPDREAWVAHVARELREAA